MSEDPGTGPSRSRPSLAVAELVAVIERAAVDLALAEEPSRFIAALEMGAPATKVEPRRD